MLGRRTLTHRKTRRVQVAFMFRQWEVVILRLEKDCSTKTSYYETLSQNSAVFLSFLRAMDLILY